MTNTHSAETRPPQLIIVPPVHITEQTKTLPHTNTYRSTQSCMHIKRLNTPIQLIMPHTIQGDTGANCSATNLKHILWNYKHLEHPINIETYSDQQGENTCQAIGTGIIRIIADNDTTMHWTALYIPKSTGTVLSPDKYVSDNKDNIYKFVHEGCTNGHGTIQFHDKQHRDITTIQMNRRKDGLWFTKNPILLPPNHHVPRTIHDDIRRTNRHDELARQVTSTCHPLGENIVPQYYNIKQQQTRNQAYHQLEVFEVDNHKSGFRDNTGKGNRRSTSTSLRSFNNSVGSCALFSANVSTHSETHSSYQHPNT